MSLVNLTRNSALKPVRERYTLALTHEIVINGKTKEAEDPIVLCAYIKAGPSRENRSLILDKLFAELLRRVKERYKSYIRKIEDQMIC